MIPAPSCCGRATRKEKPKPDRIMQVTVLGLGTLGSQIAFHAAFRRFRVSGYDIDERALVNARCRLDALPAAYLQDKVLSATTTTTHAARASLHLTTNLDEAVRHSDLIIEAAPEIVDVKRELLHTASRVARPDAIIATNSS